MAEPGPETDRSAPFPADIADHDRSKSGSSTTGEGEQAPVGTTAAKQAGPHPRAGTPRGGPGDDDPLGGSMGI